MTSRVLMNPLLRRLHRHRFPGLPVTEGDFPIQQTPLPAPTVEPPVPADGEDTDSDATVDYRGNSLLALVAGDDDALIRLPTSYAVPSFVPLDGDGFASWLTKTG